MDNRKFEYPHNFKEFSPKINLPKIAYSFLPSLKDEIDFNEAKPYTSVRKLFDGNSHFFKHEKEKLEELSAYITTKKGFHLPKWWNPSESLRFLQANAFHISKTYENISRHVQWKKNTLPIKLNNEILNILNSGFMYLHGRDCRFRPIFVVSPNKFQPTKYSFSSWLNSIIFLNEFTINNLLLPGKVENWNIIVDLQEVSLYSIPYEMKSIMAVIQENFKCRLFRLYVLNLSSFASLALGVAKSFLGSTLESKLKLVKAEGGTHSQLFELIHPSQVEKRFGGAAPNMEKNYYPPLFESNEYLVKGDDIDTLLNMKEEEYFNIINSKRLNPLKKGFQNQNEGNNKDEEESQKIKECLVYGDDKFYSMQSFQKGTQSSKRSKSEVCNDNFGEPEPNLCSNIQKENDKYIICSPDSQSGKHISNKLWAKPSNAEISHNGIITMGKSDSSKNIESPAPVHNHSFSQQSDSFNIKVEEISSRCGYKQVCSSCVVF